MLRSCRQLKDVPPLIIEPLQDQGIQHVDLSENIMQTVPDK
jgi:hypothetical protein